MRANSNQGASIIEVLLAVTVAVTCSIMISLVFPKASKSQSDNHRRMLASSIASSKLDELKNNPIDAIPNTAAPAMGYFRTTMGCDCSKVDMMAHPTAFDNTPATLGGTSFVTFSCVNEMAPVGGGAFLPICPPLGIGADFKHIRVQVYWGITPSTGSVVQDEMVSRY